MDYRSPTAADTAHAEVAGRLPRLVGAVHSIACIQGGATTTVTCILLEGTLASSSSTASITISFTQTNILTAGATFPIVASAGDEPMYAEREKV